MTRRSPLAEAISVGVLNADSSALELICQHLRKVGYQTTSNAFQLTEKYMKRLSRVDVFVLFCKDDFEQVVDFCMKARRYFPKAATLVVGERIEKKNLRLLEQYGIDSVLQQPITWSELTIEIQNLSSIKIFEDLIFENDR